MENRIQKIEEQISLIKDNHLFHLKADMSEVKTDLIWIKDMHKANRGLIYAVLATSIAGLLLALIKLL